MLQVIDNLVPFGQVSSRSIEIQLTHDDVVQPLLVQPGRNLVNIVDVNGRDDCVPRHVSKQGDLASLLLWQGSLGPAQQHVRLNADGAQLFDGVLCGLGLYLAGCRHIGHQSEVNIGRLIGCKLDTHLSNAFKKR